MMRDASLHLLLFWTVGTYLPLSAAEYRVSSAAPLAGVIEKLRPGDTVVMANGEWKDQCVLFRGHGTREKPITLRAKTPGQVVLTGHSSITLSGEHMVVSGLYLKNGGGSSNG